MNSELSAGLRARVALEKAGFRPAHALGQNFILDDEFLSSLIAQAGVNDRDNVLEIGPGAGVMTRLLAGIAARVLAVEMDEKLRPVLENVLEGCDNVRVEFADALRADLGTLARETFDGEAYRVVANLPYYITADLISKLTACVPQPESLCVMVQKEAAERLMSAPGSKNWCALAAVTRYFGSCEVLEEVAPEHFSPPPHVDSCFIRIDFYPERALAGAAEKRLLKLIRCCFAMRRKTLVNNLKATCGLDPEFSRAARERAGLNPQTRGEALQLDELVRLSEVLADAL